MKTLLAVYGSEFCLLPNMFDQLHRGLLRLGVDSALAVYGAERGITSTAVAPGDAGRMGRLLAVEADDTVTFIPYESSGPDILRKAQAEGRILIDCNAKTPFKQYCATLSHLSIITDPPFGFFDRIRQINSQGSQTTCVDRGLPTVFSQLGLTRPAFLPHGGPDPDLSAPPSAERPIDVLFLGNLLDSPHWQFIDQYFATDTHPVVVGLFQAAAEKVLEGEETLQALTQSGRAFGVDVLSALPRDAVMRMADDLMRWARARRRLLLLESLPDCRITLAGSVAPGFFSRVPDNITVLGRQVSGADALTLMAQAKILINTSRSFPEGSHERIWYGISQGAVIATDRSTYVEESLRDGEHVFYIPSSPEDFPAVNDALAGAGIDQLARMREACREPYGRLHTWGRRAETLVDILDALYGGDHSG